MTHCGAWLPSLLDCRSPRSLPNWLLSAADATGALLGPLLFAAAASNGIASSVSIEAGAGFLPALHPAFWFQAAAIVGICLCLASTCFGV